MQRGLGAAIEKSPRDNATDSSAFVMLDPRRDVTDRPNLTHIHILTKFF